MLERVITRAVTGVHRSMGLYVPERVGATGKTIWLGVVVRFISRYGSDDCGTGHHGDKGESYKNVVHHGLLGKRVLLCTNPD